MKECNKKNLEFYLCIVNNLLKIPQKIAEFCCGNGELSALIDRNHELEKIDLVDIIEVNKLPKNLKLIKSDFELHLDGVDSFKPEVNTLIISVHPCGELTDKIINIAIESRNSFAIMPCCYNSRMKKYDLLNPPSPKKLHYLSEKEYYDTFRIQYAKEKGFNVIKCQINPKITPMNNVLIGIPN